MACLKPRILSTPLSKFEIDPGAGGALEKVDDFQFGVASGAIGVDQLDDSALATLVGGLGDGAEPGGVSNGCLGGAGGGDRGIGSGLGDRNGGFGFPSCQPQLGFTGSLPGACLRDGSAAPVEQWNAGAEGDHRAAGRAFVRRHALVP